MTQDADIPLVVKVIIAMVLGVLYGQLLLSMQGSAAASVLLYALNAGVTLADLFSKYIHFFIPIMIVGLLAPAIADFGKDASQMLVSTVVIAYFSTIIICLMAWFIGDHIIVAILNPHMIAAPAKVEVISFLPNAFVFDPLMGIITAIALAFSIGLGAAYVTTNVLYDLLEDVREVVNKILLSFIVPILPYFIGIIFARLSAQGSIWFNLLNFANVIMVIVALQLLYLAALYLLVGWWSGVNPLIAIQNILPAYFTALGTQSSAATIPVSLKCAEKNGVSEDVRDFVIPLCSTVHLAGSAATQTFGAMAIYYVFEGVVPDSAQMLSFIVVLGIILVATPGVPGGSPAAVLPILKSFLGFSPDMSSLMYTLGITCDAFSTAANVAGDGAIAIVMGEKYQRELVRSDSGLYGHSK